MNLSIQFAVSEIIFLLCPINYKTQWNTVQSTCLSVDCDVCFCDLPQGDGKESSLASVLAHTSCLTPPSSTISSPTLMWVILLPIQHSPYFLFILLVLLLLSILYS